MFDRIFEFIEMVWEWFIPFTVINCYEQGVVLRWGILNRELAPGFHWIWPFGIDSVKSETVVRQTSYLDPQSLTSADGKSVTVAAIVIFEITDIVTFLLHIDEGETDMNNMIYGIVTDVVEATKWDEIRKSVFNFRVYGKALRECKDYCGVEIIDIKWSDKAAARNIRLWND